MSRWRSLMVAILVGFSASVLHAQPAGEVPGPSSDPALAPSQAGGGSWSIRGTVTETMNAGIYTYVSVEREGDKVWVAAPRFEVAIGDRVLVPEGARMADFYSAQLERRFDVIHLVAFVRVEGRTGAAPSIPEIHSRTPAEVGFDIDVSDVEPVEGGQTVAQILGQRDALAGHEVTFRGRVVKSTAGVLGRNWIHLQDGTSAPGGKDTIIVTTTEDADLGDTVLVRGIVVLDRDFGYGYRYALLVEASTVTVE